MSDTIWHDVAANESPEITKLRDLAKHDRPALVQVMGARFGYLIASHQIAVTKQGWMVLDTAPEGSIILNDLPFQNAARLFFENVKTIRPECALNYDIR